MKGIHTWPVSWRHWLDEDRQALSTLVNPPSTFVNRNQAACARRALLQYRFLAIFGRMRRHFGAKSALQCRSPGDIWPQRPTARRAGQEAERGLAASNA